ncbi:MAG: aldehyde dehydrogenase family protein, partial [Nanoarchaeota archaeon]
MAIQTIDPTTEEVVKTFQEITWDETDNILKSTDAAFLEWKKTSFQERAVLMKKAAALLRKHPFDYASLMTLEMGKVIKEAEAEIEKCA